MSSGQEFFEAVEDEILARTSSESDSSAGHLLGEVGFSDTVSGIDLILVTFSDGSRERHVKIVRENPHLLAVDLCQLLLRVNLLVRSSFLLLFVFSLLHTFNPSKSANHSESQSAGVLWLLFTTFKVFSTYGIDNCFGGKKKRDLLMHLKGLQEASEQDLNPYALRKSMDRVAKSLK